MTRASAVSSASTRSSICPPRRVGPVTLTPTTNPIIYSDPTGLIADYDNIGNEQTTWGLINPEAQKIADDAQATQQSDLVGGKNTDQSKQPEVGGVILPTFETLRKGIYGAGYQDHEYGLALHDWAYRMCFGGNTRGPEQFCSEAQRLGLLDFDKTAILEYLPGVDLYRCVTTGSTESCVSAGIDLIPFSKLAKLGGIGAKAALDAATSPYSKSLAQAFCKTGGNSFVPGTLVLMADGATKPIEDINVGDYVYASDPTTGEHGAHEVTHTITGTGDKHLTTLTIDTDGPRGDATATITATDKHPFWNTTHQQWADAANLKPGDNLATSTSGRVAVLDTTSTERVLTVHNLTIHSLHTYYVLAGQTPVLVHNTGPCGTGTVWDDIVGTQPTIPGTGGVPKSFELTAGGNRVWVHGNVTDHFAEMANSVAARGASPEMVGLASQQQLRSLQAAVADATRGGVPLNQRMIVGGWQLEFRQGVGDALPALIHGRYVG